MPIPNRPLQNSKLHPPTVTHNLVVRPRLLARLDLSLSYPVTLVCAAAGFGKSTLVSNWIESRSTGQGTAVSLPAAWLSLDESDNDLNVFLHYFIAALRTIFASACAGTEELLLARQQAPLSLVAAVLGNEIELFTGSFVLVLEDYHLVSDGAVHNLLNELMRHWPLPMHLILVSRRDPPLPLASLRATGRINEIRGRELRFTSEETTAYLHQALPAPPEQPAIGLIERHTEGWIAGLQLATLSLAATVDAEGTMAALAASNADLGGYLADEVLSRQPDPIQGFLLQTSILDRFCASLCEAVATVIDPEWSARACMDWLERADLFVYALDKERIWYRYHHLFLDMLRTKALAVLGVDRLNELHRRASAWYTGQGLVDEGLRHALASDDLDLAAQFMEQGLRDVLNREDRPTLERWLRLLPDDYIQSRPGLLMIRVWELELTWQLDAQSKIVRQVDLIIEQDAGGSVSPSDLQVMRGQLLMFQSQDAYLSNQPALAIARCQEALALVPRMWTYVRGTLMLYMGLSMQASGEGDAAERMLLDTYGALGNKTDSYAQRLLMTLCFNHLQAGSLEKTAQIARVMLEQTTASRLPVLQGWAHYFLGFVHYLWNDLDTAAQHFAELVDHRHTAQAAAVRDAETYLALIYQITGDSFEAQQTIGLLERTDVEQSGRRADTTAALQADLQLRQGDVESASRWADAFVAPVPDRPLVFFVQPHITKVRILLARDLDSDVQAALQILDALDVIAERTFNTRIKIEILILRALALDASGNVGDAATAMREAVELSRSGGFIRVFVDQSSRTQHLLTMLAKRGVAPATVRRILAAFPDKTSSTSVEHTQVRSPHRPSQSQVNTPLVEPLTARELEILALLCEPMSIKEIALSVSISPLTVRRHAVNLYAKLGVNSRWDAVTRASTLGILSPR